MEKTEMRASLDCLERGAIVDDGMHALLFGDVELRGKNANEEARKEVLERSLRGEHIELNARILAYGQGGAFSNRKHTRFTNGALSQYAKTSKQTLFQRNHSLATEDTGGVIAGAKMERDGDARQLMQDVRLVYPWAVQAAAMGVMRAFSIHWRPMSLDSIACTACKAPMLQCPHFPGDRVETKSGDVIVVEFEYSDVEAVETSHVTFPAVRGTGVREVSEALDAIRAQWRARSYPSKEMHVNDEIKTKVATALGLPEDSGESALVAEAQRLRADNAELRDALKTHQALEAECAELRAEAEQARKAQREGECEALVHELASEGRLTPGGEREKLLRQMYASGQVDTAKALAASYREGNPIVPVGRPQAKQVQTTPDGKPDWQALYAGIPEHLKSTRWATNPEAFIRANHKQLGIQLPEGV